jgi:geranylgeranyl diphosphate synthase type II
MSITSLNQLQIQVEKGLQDLSFPVQPESLYQPVTYMLSLGGKRVRPVLVLLANELFGGDSKVALSAALGVEVFHNFTLLHDDIMDNAPLRRAKQTVHAKWNSNVAILSGDAMFVEACKLMMQVPDNSVRNVMDVFTTTALEVCEGQQYDMDFETSNNVSIQQYLDMIRLKTAVLVGGSLKIGALIGNASQEAANHLYDFGVNLGVAFQLQDDILDVYGDTNKFGKQVGGDILSNKKTFLLLTALANADKETSNELNYLLNLQIDATNSASEKVKAVTIIYNKLTVKEIALAKMNELYNEALKHLDAIQVDENRKVPLRELAASLMIREV